MEISDSYLHVGEVVGQILGHALGEGGDQHPIPSPAYLANFFQKIIHLMGYRTDVAFRLREAGRTDNLLDDPVVTLFQLELCRCS